MDINTLVSTHRRQELALMAEEGAPSTAISTAIIETLEAVHDIPADFRKMAKLDRTMVITNQRHRELVALAALGHTTEAIKATIRDTAIGARTGKPLPPALEPSRLAEIEASVPKSALVGH